MSNLKKILVGIRGLGFFAWAGILIATALGFGPAHAQTPTRETGKYVSADRCKSCHDAPYKGEPYNKWAKDKHSQAVKTLATDKAKQLGAKLGVPEPQKSDKCLKCHVTAYLEPKEKKLEGFKNELGVQCDSCHGPGEFHMETRTDILVELDFKEGDDPFGSEKDDKYVQLPKGEIITETPEEVCKKCHNKDSPSYKEDWNSPERRKAVRHLDPRKKR